MEQAARKKAAEAAQAQEPVVAPLSAEERQKLVDAVRSLNQSYDGFNVDDFMNSLATLAAFHAQGRSFDDVF